MASWLKIPDKFTDISRLIPSSPATNNKNTPNPKRFRFDGENKSDDVIEASAGGHTAELPIHVLRINQLLETISHLEAQLNLSKTKISDLEDHLNHSETTLAIERSERAAE